MSRFPSKHEENSRKRASEYPTLPNSKRQTLHAEREGHEVDEIDLKRQSFVIPNAEELEAYFDSFNHHHLPSKVPADPRKSNNPEDLRRMVKKIDRVLKETEFRPLEFRDIRYLSSKDFKDIFIHLLHFVSPDFKFKKKFEDEIPKLLKTLNYPSADQFNSKMFYSIAPHSFYLFLHLLDFMAENAKILLSYSTEEITDHNFFDKEKAITVEDMTRLYRDFTATAYQYHVRGDPIDEVVTELISIFDHLIKEAETHQLELTKQSAISDETLKKFNEAQEKCFQLEKQHNNILSDKEKFIEYCNTKKAKIEKYATLYNRITEEMRGLAKKSDAVVEKVNQLKDMLKARGISLEEMDRLREERVQLETEHAATGIRIEEMMAKSKVASNNIHEIDKNLKSAFIRLRNELTTLEYNQANSPLMELKNTLEIDDNRILDYVLNMTDNPWAILNDWISERKTFADNKIDHLQNLKTEIIDKKENQSEIEKSSRDFAQKIDQKTSIYMKREKEAMAEFAENDQDVGKKEQKIVDLKSQNNNKGKTYEQKMDEAHAELVQLEYDQKIQENNIKDELLLLAEDLKSLKVDAERVAKERAAFADRYSRSSDFI